MRASNVIGILSENGLHHGSNALSSLEMLYSNCCIILAELSIAHLSHFRLLRRYISFSWLERYLVLHVHECVRRSSLNMVRPTSRPP